MDLILQILNYCLNYYRRPKLILEPHCWSPEQNVKRFGFLVRNKGRSIAKRVYGEVIFNSSSHRAIHRICWNDSPNYEIDMLPGMLNEYWFYVAELRSINGSLERLWGCFSFSGPAKEHFEITVKLYWEYYGLRSLSRKFHVNLVSWDTAEIRSLKKHA